MMHHVSQTIRGALWNRRFGDFQHDDGRPMTPREAFESLCDELALGHHVVPVAGCNNFDPQRGCLGHPETLPETLEHLSATPATSSRSDAGRARNAPTPAPQSLSHSVADSLSDTSEVGRS